ncbi:acyl-CoA synthetase (AMP-forming)/AMP-acid ligase II [Desulfosporosinus orientis DSM 765]|uniref:Acyl-CoA synthetase (AMP-forming)/AMP-acid ligase II n=1 Tax=Desulfosporosinus orientis (strain ATCC 19365 / DSM 765 / NCIMB 8382 / VKM B-1628 / Singapore I) TaxID=768706 RepID=G7W5Z1_DESOD|nr:long-chain fatty acid--CoA ligase [Desulfosporosinus orientis]AET67367.1 acyl-CoA synthetase (AMP-forming)/AMP-acid ligase II [Desulfosporosinus orientis DSM 765]
MIWTQYYDPEVPTRLEYREAKLDELFRQSVKNHSDAVALIFFSRLILYRELGDYVNRLATALQTMGIQQGDRVALLLPNCPQYVISYFAILSIGAVVVPINPLSTEFELLHIFRDAQPVIGISLDLLAGKLESVRETCHKSGEHQILKKTFYTALNEFMPMPIKLLYPLSKKISPQAKERLPHCLRFKSLLKQEPQPLIPNHINLHEDIAVLIYTGGTTGKPKGVMLSHHALAANAAQGASWVQMSKDDRLLAVLPIFHGFGMSVCMNAPLISGSSCVLLPRFTGDELLKGIHRFQPTLFAGVPTMYIGIINHPRLTRYNLSSLRGCFVGAAPLAPEIKRQFEELTASKLMEGYGLTEAVTAVCANPYRGINKTGSIGIPFPDVSMEIRDIDTGENVLTPREIGEIVLKGPDLMLGYYNQPQETASAIRKGWLYTGDMGYMDDDGYFYIVDRKKDMIITGGFNVYPREVEDVLYLHPAVKEACVIGTPDNYKGELVKAFITLKEGASIGEEEIISFCREHLIPYKVPQQVEIRPELPKTAIGKILKRSLRDQTQIYGSKTNML